MNEIGPRATPEQTEALPHPNAEATHEELQVSVLSNAARAAEARLQQLITTHPNLEEGEKGKLWERIQKMVQKEVDRNMEAIQQFETQDPTVFREAFLEVRDTVQYFIEAVGTGVEQSLEVAADNFMITDREFQELYENLWFLKPLEIKGDESQQDLLRRKEDWRMARLKEGELERNSAADLREYAEKSAVTGGIVRERETTNVAQIAKEELVDDLLLTKIRGLVLPEKEAMALATITDEFFFGKAMERDPETYERLRAIAEFTGNPLDLKTAEMNKPFSEVLKDNWKDAALFMLAVLPAEAVLGKGAQILFKAGKWLPEKELLPAMKELLGPQFVRLTESAPTGLLIPMVKNVIEKQFGSALRPMGRLGSEAAKNVVEGELKSDVVASVTEENPKKSDIEAT